MTHHASSWTERTAAKDFVPEVEDVERRLPRQAFHNPQTAFVAAHHRSHAAAGAAGHWIYMAGVMAPLIIGELITDPAKRWRATRIASVAVALAYEGLHGYREHKRREEQEARLATCRSRD
jgi:hypothetical protein